MRNYFLAIVLVSCVIYSYGQTTATDFTVSNCDGETYNLFEDLDAGKVVVITWIMPCAPCISPTVSAFVETQSYDPEKVKFLLVDDYANTSCSQLQTWASNYQMGDVDVFSTPQISMSDYGGDGMPKAVVVGCNSHKVYFNRNFDINNSTDGLSEAIDLALSECANGVDVEDVESYQQSQVYPNPAHDRIVISSDKNKRLSFSIVNALGEVVVEEEDFESGFQLDISHLPIGNYFINIRGEDSHSFTKLKL